MLGKSFSTNGNKNDLFAPELGMWWEYIILGVFIGLLFYASCKDMLSSDGLLVRRISNSAMSDHPDNRQAHEQNSSLRESVYVI